jgi:hypothetical protein
MKNIHILPTDKHSRLIVYSKMLNSFRLLDEPIIDWKHKRNIYITSDEEIKEGDWTLMFDDFGHLFLCDKPQQYLGIEKGHHLNKGLRKIILTTDSELIKDGVQAIDDEFLEWFVKNPSCEFVEVKKEKTFGRSNPLDKLGFTIIKYNINMKNLRATENMVNYFKKEQETILKNKIIIPQEEPKQDRTCTNSCSVVCGECQIFEPKKETLEEAFTRIYKSIDFTEFCFTSFELGVKWQAKRMYSEITDDCINDWLDYRINNSSNISFVKWFEQFKKK